MTRISLSLLRWLTLWLVLAAPLRALEIRQVIWGFDGHLVPGRFNPVSFLVDNPQATAFEGQMVLTQSEGGLRGTEHLQPVYLAPHAARWVQFHVFVGIAAGHYGLQWGQTSRDRYEIFDEPSLGAPAVVWARDSTSAFASVGALKAFPEELFPTTVAATEALDAIVLDHVPDWEPARREAFADWLKLGGTVHLVRAPDGTFPRFGEGLEFLNTAGDEARHGAGRILRHQVGIRELTPFSLSTKGEPPATLKQSQQPVIYDLEAQLAQRLASLTRPNVNWGVIHLLALAYIAAIGPIHYRFRRRLDYRLSILVFLGAVALFGTLFAVIGRRGYDESQTVNSLSIARSLGSGRYDVTQWISAFATSGDIYTLTHDSPANLYGPIGADAGRSRTFNGKDGRIQLDIPLYSSRTFVHRAVMKGDDIGVTVEKGPTKFDFRTVRLRTNPRFPKNFSKVELLADGEIWELTLKDGVLEPTPKSAEKIATRFSRDALAPLSYSRRYLDNPEAQRDMMPLLMARVIAAPDVFLQNVERPPRRGAPWILFVVAPAAESFRLHGPGFERESDWVLYVQDINPS